MGIPIPLPVPMPSDASLWFWVIPLVLKLGAAVCVLGSQASVVCGNRNFGRTRMMSDAALVSVAAHRRPPTEDECADWAMELADGKSWADIIHAAKHLHDLPREIGRFLARYHRGDPPAADLFSDDPAKRRAFITAAVRNFRAPETDVAAWRSGERAFEDMVSEEAQ